MSERLTEEERCVFCRLDLVVGVEWCADTDGAGIYRFPPLGPVTDGHMFAVSPRLRTHEAATSATLPNSMGSSAASLVWRSATNNIITSIGAVATQTDRPDAEDPA